jgi:hypothetical protein
MSLIRKGLVLVAALVASTAFALTAVPAFTATPADSGSVTGTVTALGAGACLQLTSSAVVFGTLPFSTRTQPSMAQGNPTPSVQNCGNVNETISIAGSDATGPNTSWHLTVTNPCVKADGSAQINAYGVTYDAASAGHAAITPNATPISTFAPGATTPVGLQLFMPCVGSSGDGQVVSFSINLTAAVA